MSAGPRPFVAAWAAKVDAARRRLEVETSGRDQAVRDAYAAGVAVPDLARAARLTRGQIYNILRGRRR